jgi:hypothetical protein
MRLASVVLIACVAGFAASDSSADDAPPKADATKPLRLALVPGKTYLYRLTESIAVRREIDHPAAGKLTSDDGRVDIVWDTGVSLQRLTESGDTIVSLMPTRVRGTVTDSPRRPDPFDSDDPKAPVTSPLLGRGLRVTLSSAARVKEVTCAATERVRAVADEPGVAEIDFDPAMAKGFAQQFFHELPELAPDALTAWQQTRALAPEWIRGTSMVLGYTLGDADERSIVQKILPDVVVAGVRARGRRDIRRTKEPEDLDSVSLRQQHPGSLGEQLEEWLVLGEVRLRRDTGMVELRTATTTLGTHVNPIRVPKGAQSRLPGVPTEDAFSYPTDLTYETTLRVELVETR